MDPAQNTSPQVAPPAQQTVIATQTPASPESDSILNPQPASPEPPKTPRSMGKLIFLLAAFILVLLLVGLGGATYAVAYEKIKLDKYPDIQRAVSQAVISLPFMPKTPKYLITRSTLAHQKVTKQSFNLSAAIDSSDFYSVFGVNKFDAEAKGAIDYSDPKNPKISMDASVTKDFNIELRKKDPVLYFKINKIPATLLNLFYGIEPPNLDGILEKWIAYDTTPLETEARKNADVEINPLSEDFIDELLVDYMDDKILSKMVLENASEEGFSVYRLILDADSELINYIGRKLDKNVYALDNENALSLSDTVKEMRWEFLIDKRDFYTRKVIITLNIEFDDAYLGNSSSYPITPIIGTDSKANITFAAKFGNFGEEVVIETPTESMTIEEFTQTIGETFSSLNTSTGQISADSPAFRDAKRVTDLGNLKTALEAFRAECGIYPETPTELLGGDNTTCESAGVYLVFVPKDPQDYSNYHYQPSSDKTEYDLCAKLESEETYPLSATCPDPYFNYHITNP